MRDQFPRPGFDFDRVTFGTEGTAAYVELQVRREARATSTGCLNLKDPDASPGMFNVRTTSGPAHQCRAVVIARLAQRLRMPGTRRHAA